MEKITIKGKDNACIDANFYNTGKKDAKGTIIICHGFGEHSGSYQELAEHLEQKNYVSIVFSQRGHGDLPLKKRGAIPSYQTFLDDIEAIVDYTKDEMPDIPVALYGHSMGGNIALNYLLKHGQSDFKCVILEAPWLALKKIKVGPVKASILKFISYPLHNFEMPKCLTLLPIPIHELTSVEVKQQEIEREMKDELHHNRMTWRLSSGVNDGRTYALKNAQRLSIPMLLAKAEGDEVVCNKTIDEFYATCSDEIKIKDKETGKQEPKSYKSQHTIHKDEKRYDFFEDVTEFLNDYM